MPAVVSAAVSIFSAVVSGTAGAAVVGAAGLTGVAAAITSTAVNAAVSVALTAGINAIAPKPKVSMQNQMQAAIGAISPTYMIAGRTITAGVSMVENMVSGKNNDIASYIATLSHVGECGSVDAVKWGNDILTFDALGNCISPAKYAGACVLYQRSGGWTQTGMQIASINGFQPAYDQPSEWTSNHRALGCLTAWLVIRTWKDCWKNNNNQPQFICSANTCELYDPRTQALCTTWAQRQNFACWAYSWAKKWSSPTGVKLAGIGWSDSQIDLVALSYWANICDANGWKISAVIDCDPSNKSEVMAAICQGGGATPVYRGGKFSVFYAAPRVSVATITEDDFCAKPKFQSNVPFTYRPNRIFPRFISESSNWTITDGSLVTSSSYLSADGGSEKTETMEFPYAGGGNSHVGQLAAYALANAREPFRETLFFKPQVRYKFSVTDCIIINAPAYGYNNYKCIVTKRDFADDFTSQVEAVTETDTKHPFALGQTTTPPDFAGQFKLNGDYCPAPAAGSWSVVATQLTQGGTSIPCLKISGASDYNLASAIVIRYRLNTIGSPWLGIANLPPTATKHEIVSITPNTSYIIGVSYRNQFGNEGAITELTAVDTGTFVAGSAANVDWQSGVTGTGKPSDNANNTALNPTTGALTGISSGAGTIVDNTKISISPNGALSGAGGGQVTIGGLGYTGALNATRNAVSSGTAAPSGGSNGDMYVQVDGSGNAVLTWVNIGGTWKPDYDAKTNVATLQSQLAGSTGSALLTAINQKIDTATANATFASAANLAATNAKINTNPNLMPYPVPKNFTDLPSSYGWVSTGNGLGFSNADGLSWKSNFYFLNRYQANAPASAIYAFFDIITENWLYNNTYITLSYVAAFSNNSGDYSQCLIEIVDNNGAHIAWAGSWQNMGSTAPNRYSNTFLINLGSPQPAETFKIRMHYALNMGATTALVYQYLFFTDIKLEFGNIATAFTLEGNNKALQTQTSINQSAIANTNGKLEGKIALTTDAGGVVTGIEILSMGGTNTPVSKIKFNAAKAEFSGDVLVDGTLTASKIVDLSIPTAKLQDNSVSNIQDVAEFTPNVTTANVWQQVKTIPFNATGKKVKVEFACFAEALATGAPQGSTIAMRIKRGSTILFDKQIAEGNPLGPDGFGNYYPVSDIKGFSFFVTDNPAAGSYTYSMELFYSSLSLCSTSQANFRISEMMK